MRNSVSTLAIAAAMALSGIVHAEGSAIEDKAKEKVAEASEKLKQELSFGPFRLAVGPTEEGAFGTSFVGSGSKTLLAISGDDAAVFFDPSHLSTTAAFDYAVDAGWTTDEDNPNNASVSLKPKLQLLWTKGRLKRTAGEDPWAKLRSFVADEKELLKACMEAFNAGSEIDIKQCRLDTMPAPQPRAYIDVFGDLRYRYGSIDQAGAVVRVNQAIVGGGIGVVAFTPSSWEFVDQWPVLTVGYYTVQDTDSNAAAIPDEIEADYVKVGLSTKIGFGPKTLQGDAGRDRMFKLYFDVDGGVATDGPDKDWEALYKAQLVYRMEGSFKPAVTFREGKEQGLDYDKELIIGFLMELL